MPTPIPDSSEKVTELRDKFIAAVDHPTAREYAQNATTDFEFREGIQWTKDEINELKERNQAPTVENEISPQPQDSVIPKNIDRSRTTHSAPLRSRTASSIFSIQNLLTKARAKIQERKRKKLDKIMSLFESPPTSPKGSVSGGQGNSEISNSDIQKLLRTTKRSATRYLDILEKEQKIIQIGKAGRGVKYIKKP